MAKKVNTPKNLFIVAVLAIGLTAGFFLGQKQPQKAAPLINQGILKPGTTSAPEAEVQEPNDTFEQATSLSPGIETQGSFGPKSNVDFYRFGVKSPSQVKIVFDHLPTEYKLEVFDSQKQIIATTVRKGFVSSEGIITAQNPGQYYIKVTSTYTDDNTKPYTIRIAILPFFD